MKVVKLRIAIAEPQDEVVHMMEVPVQYEPYLLTVLESVLHPETVPPECRESMPTDAQELLALVVRAVYIRWADIPDPGPGGVRNN